MQGIGLHLRLTTNLPDIAAQACRLSLPFFQCFLTLPQTNKYIPITHEIADQFKLYKQHRTLFVHGSYKINLASEMHAAKTFYFLKKELALARLLGCDYFILHPGSVSKKSSVDEGIKTIAWQLNRLLNSQEDYPTILLENVAFGATNIGGDVRDLVRIREQLDNPDKVKYCIDTAHAYAYGYDLATAFAREQFIRLLQDVLGLEAICLIHLNDTKEELSSRHDKHDIPGKGLIGIDALKQLLLHECLRNKPFLIEPPAMAEEELASLLLKIENYK